MNHDNERKRKLHEISDENSRDDEDKIVKKRRPNPKGESLGNFLQTLKTEKRPGQSYSFKVDKDYLGLFGKPKVKKNTTAMTVEDYDSGYISDDGEKLIRKVKKFGKPTETQLQQFNTESEGETSEKKRKKSRAKKDIFTGEMQEHEYYGVKVKFRVDYTKTKGEYEPHARAFIGDDNISTKHLSEYSMFMEDRNKDEFMKGFKGTPLQEGEEGTHEHALGVSMRALVRISDLFKKPTPLLDGRQMAQTQTPRHVSTLFHNEEFGTGGLGTQNSGVGATGEYKAFHTIVDAPEKKHTFTTRVGTNLDEKPDMRKVKAINSTFPNDKPLIVVRKKNTE